MLSPRHIIVDSNLLESSYFKISLKLCSQRKLDKKAESSRR